MKRGFLLVSIFAVLVLIATACGGAATPAATETPAATATTAATATATAAGTGTATGSGGTGQVSIKNLAFNPPTIAIKVGESVQWTNDDTTAHTVTSDSGIWDSGQLQPGQTFTQQFPTPGAFPYHCSIHTFMHGTITVQ
jgi:plastocyanin